jgi:glutamate/tyrosine decarboxylase-like PLP-dependent enzyme
MIDLVADHLENVAAGPVYRPMSVPERSRLADQALPAGGLAPDEMMRRIADWVMPFPMGNGHPRFFAWVNSAPHPAGVLADLVASGMDPSCAGGDHAASYLEQCVIRWLAELAGYPGAGGLLVSGGSMANLTGLAAARHWAAKRDGWDVRSAGLQGAGGRRLPLVLYVSAEGHGSLRKAAELLGLGGAGIRVIPVDAAYRMDVAGLRAAVEADLERGASPFCVAASAGTVNTGAVDALAAIADVCADHDLWLHVDGSYGAAGRLDPAVAGAYAGLERAASVALDPHKWMSVPVECGALLVRDPGSLRGAFSLVPPYLRTEPDQGFGGPLWYSELGFQQTRGFRALKTWATLAALGRDGLARLVARHRRLARHLADLVDAAPDLERLAPAELSVVCFRYRPPELAGASPAALDDLNRAVLREVQRGGQAFPSGTELHGQFALRACVLHHATTEDDLATLVAAVQAAGRTLS